MTESIPRKPLKKGSLVILDKGKYLESLESLASDVELPNYVFEGPGEILNIKSDIRFAIDQAFRKNNIKIPYPQRDLHIVTDIRKKNHEGDV